MSGDGTLQSELVYRNTVKQSDRQFMTFGTCDKK